MAILIPLALLIWYFKDDLSHTKIMSPTLPTPQSMTQVQAANYIVSYIQRPNFGQRRKLVAQGLQILGSIPPNDRNYVTAVRQAYRFFNNLLFQGLLTGRCGINVLQTLEESEKHRKAEVLEKSYAICEWSPHPLEPRETAVQITFKAFEKRMQSPRRALGVLLHEMIHAYLCIYCSREESLLDHKSGGHSPAWYKIASVLEQCGEEPINLNVQMELWVDSDASDITFEP